MPPSHPTPVDPAQHNPFTLGLYDGNPRHKATIIRLEYWLPLWARWVRQCGPTSMQVSDRQAGPWTDLPLESCTTELTMPQRQRAQTIYYDEVEYP